MNRCQAMGQNKATTRVIGRFPAGGFPRKQVPANKQQIFSIAVCCFKNNKSLFYCLVKMSNSLVHFVLMVPFFANSEAACPVGFIKGSLRHRPNKKKTKSMSFRLVCDAGYEQGSMEKIDCSRKIFLTSCLFFRKFVAQYDIP